MTKYIVTSEHAVDVGGGHVVEPGGEFDDQELLDAVQERYQATLKDMQEDGRIMAKDDKPKGSKS